MEVLSSRVLLPPAHFERSLHHPDGPRGLFATGFQGVDPPRVKTPARVFCTEAVRHFLCFSYLGST